MEHYCIPEFDSVSEFLSHLAHKSGRLKKGEITCGISGIVAYMILCVRARAGGVPDVNAAARSVLRDWNT